MEATPEPSGRSRLAVAAGAVALGLLVVLSLLLYSRAQDSLEERAELQVRDAAMFAAQLVEEQTLRISELVTAHAEHLSTIAGAPIERLDARQRAMAARELAEMRRDTRGLRGAGLISTEGVVLFADPPAPDVYGRSFAFRDWYRGVTRERSPYVSRVFRSVGAGQPKTVTVAALIGPDDAPVAILTASLARRTQELVTRFSRTQGLGLVVTDQGGDVVAASGVSSDRIDSRRDDPLVEAALRGETGTLVDDDEIASYAPVETTGWTVSARLPSEIALADVDDLRTLAVLLTAIIGLLVGSLTAAVILFQRRAERLGLAAVKRRQAVHLHDGVVQTLTVAQAAREMGDHEAADRAVGDALQESKRITAELLPDDIGPGDLIRPDEP